MEILFGGFVLWLCIVGIADIGCFMFEIPWRILNAAKYLKSQGITVPAYPLYALGYVLHVFVRVLWYGTFAALGLGFVWFIGTMLLSVIKSFM